MTEMALNLSNWHLEFCKTEPYYPTLSILLSSGGKNKTKPEVVIQMSVCKTQSRMLPPEEPGKEHEN